MGAPSTPSAPAGGGYAVFGGCLRSDVAFPFLRRAPRGARSQWRLTVVAAPTHSGPCVFLGEDAVDATVRVRCYRHAAGLRLAYDDTGTFDVLDTGRRIEWAPPGSGGDGADAARQDVLGRVLPAAMHEAGTFCLHGSAVETGGEGVAFLAPKHYGKSTLAQALVRAGATLLSDDVVPAEPGPPSRLLPGVPQVRLWEDAAERLAVGATEADFGGKRRLDTGARTPRAPVRAGALYLLTPRAPGKDAPPAAREPVPPHAAAIELLRHARLAPLLGRGESVVLLDRAAALAARVPVFRLHLVRDFARLDEAVARIRAWHRTVP